MASGFAAIWVGAAVLVAPALVMAQTPEPAPSVPPASQPSATPPPSAPPPTYPAYPPPAYPPPGYPPPGYPPPYPPPGYPPPYAYPPPYPVPVPVPVAPPPPQPPSVIHDWDPEAAVPKGYRMVETVNGRTLGIGIALLGTGWFLSVLAGGVGAASEDDEPVDEADGVTSEDWAMLYVPIVGPLIAIDTLNAKTSGVGVLIADTVLQVSGAAGIVAGIIDRRYRLVREDYGSLTLTPVVWPSGSGIAARGRF